MTIHITHITVPGSLSADRAPTDKTLVLFHGWGFDSLIWKPFVAALAAYDSKYTYQLYLVDLPGFGCSDYVDWDIFKADLLTQLPPKFGLLGWSMGGLLATRLAIEEPQRVIELFNLTSTPKFIQAGDWKGIDVGVFQQFYQQLIDNPIQTRIQFIQDQLSGQTLSDDLFIIQPSVTGLRAGLDLILTWDLRSLLPQLKIPVYYLFGRLDAIVPRRMMQIMQKTYPQFNYVIFNQSAHAPFLSQPDEFIKILEA